VDSIAVQATPIDLLLRLLLQLNVVYSIWFVIIPLDFFYYL